MLDNQGLAGSTGNIGNLYYVRLNTPLGKFYKIGFTTMKSVNDRLAFQGTGDEKYIDEVLYFQFRLGAYGLEQSLHSYFSDKAAFGKYSAYIDMPLPRNGQSELYYDDVLELDGKFTPAQADFSRKAVELAITKRTYNSEIWAKRIIALNKVVLTSLMALAKVIGWSIKSVQSAIGTKTTEQELPPSVLETHNRAKLFIAELKHDQAIKRIRTHREIRIFFLIDAFSNRDFEKFKGLVNIKELGQDIANSLALDLQMFSDYLCIPNNCCMFTLMEHMNHSNCHELITKPAVDSYIPMIEEFITTRKISDMSIHIPDDPIYAIDPGYDGCDLSFNDYFGAQEFIGLLECSYISKTPYKHDDTKATVEFSIELEDKLTAERFWVVVVISLKNKMLRFTFPNLNESIRAYQTQREHNSLAMDK